MTEDLEQYFAKGELIPAVVQEASTGQVLMLAYMNKESLKRTLESGYTWFWSAPGRSSGIKACHQRPPAKGGGHVQRLR